MRVVISAWTSGRVSAVCETPGCGWHVLVKENAEELARRHARQGHVVRVSEERVRMVSGS